MTPISNSDGRHLREAQGWLELGNHREANESLEHIAPQHRSHPDVLEVRWEIYAAAKKWDACIDIAEAIIRLGPGRPQAWIHRFALHALGRTQEAFDKLLPVVNKFRKVWTIPYNLAC